MFGFAVEMSFSTRQALPSRHVERSIPDSVYRFGSHDTRDRTTISTFSAAS
jgi:hypothetical protein